MMNSFSWLDFKLGLRMMRKYPGVSLAIVFALAIGIPVSLIPNHLVEAAMGEYVRMRPVETLRGDG